jgi:hypothetical protein
MVLLSDSFPIKKGREFVIRIILCFLNGKYRKFNYHVTLNKIITSSKY